MQYAILFLLFFNTLSPFFEGGSGDVMAQSGQKFATGGNTLSGNDFLGSTNNFPLILKTFGTEKMRITETGNLGIGTANPSDKLHVAGTARMTDAAVDNQLQALSILAQTANFATAVVTGNFSAGSLTVSGNATINGNLSALGGLTTDNITSLSGNISLGNNNLNTTGNINSANISALQTTDSILNSQFSILNSQVSSIQSSQWTTLDSSTISYNGDVFVKTLNASDAVSIGNFRFSNGGAVPQPITPVRDSISSPNKLVIGSQEKAIELAADTVTMKERVGIGKIPAVALDVEGDIAASGNLRLSNLAGAGDRQLAVDANGNLKSGNPVPLANSWTTVGNAGTNPPIEFLGTTDPTDFIIKTNNAERMRITAGGNVGIGTSNPQTKFHLFESDNPLCGARMRLEYYSTALPNGCPGSSIWDITAAGTNYLTFSTPSLSNPVMTLTGSGKVGIGTGNPQSKLVIQGSSNTNNTSSLNVLDNMGTSLLLVRDNGTVLIGPANHLPFAPHNDYLLAVYGKIVGTKLVSTDITHWSDDELKKESSFADLEKEEKFTKEKFHLFGVPSEKEVLANGIETGEMFSLQLRKIEQLFKYSFLFKDYISALKQENEKLKKQMADMQKQMNALQQQLNLLMQTK